MAKLALINREHKRAALVKKYAAKRAELKAKKMSQRQLAQHACIPPLAALARRLISCRHKLTKQRMLEYHTKKKHHCY